MILDGCGNARAARLSSLSESYRWRGSPKVTAVEAADALWLVDGQGFGF